MKFSIIVPVYNVKQYLNKCMKSILEQTYTDYEVILVDDGSNDGSELLCDEYRKIDKKVKVIHQENKGLSEARNCGVRNAQGEFLIFIDSDDWISDNEFLYKLSIYSDNVDLITYDFKMVEDGNEETDFARCKTTKNLKKVYETGQAYMKDALTYYPGYRWISVKYAYKRSVWEKESIYFPMGRFYEDSLTTYKFIIKAKKVIVIDESFYVYRVARKGSITSSDTYKILYDRILSIVEPIEDIRENTVIEDDLKDMLCSNFATGYYEVLIRVGKLPKEDKENILLLLEKYKGICNYSKFAEQRMIKLVINLFGIKTAERILGLRRCIKSKKKV